MNPKATHKLVFVYNAKSGVFNALADFAHKALSPETYACNLCAITHSNFGMRGEWKEFLGGLDARVELLHSDELEKKYSISGVPLPAVFRVRDGGLETWLDAEAINACRTLGDLKRLIEGAI